MIEITVNDKNYQFHVGFLLSELIAYLKIPTGGVAVANNGAIIPFSQWATTTLKDNDNILIIQATQGG